jgi:hypothetical protein
MPDRPKPLRDARHGKKHLTRGGLIRETAYLYPDEEEALEQRATKLRCSKSEIIRRALRSYLDLDAE